MPPAEEDVTRPARRRTCEPVEIGHARVDVLVDEMGAVGPGGEVAVVAAVRAERDVDVHAERTRPCSPSRSRTCRVGRAWRRPTGWISIFPPRPSRTAKACGPSSPSTPGRPLPLDWNRRLADAGYVAPHWPTPWGRDASPIEQLVIDEELRAVDAPRPMNPIGIGWAGPTLLVAGSDEQHQRYLPGLLDGSEIWCQLFSEPGAGSDLAASPPAERDGDEFVINGQKVWTTLAHVAQYGILLARTDPDAEAHKGITYFVLDMHSPGIEVRPLVQMTGTHEFNEVFFTDVRVPAANVVGDVNDGWRLAKVTLGNERVSLSGEGALWGRGPTAMDVDRHRACAWRPGGSGHSPTPRAASTSRARSCD